MNNNSTLAAHYLKEMSLFLKEKDLLERKIRSVTNDLIETLTFDGWKKFHYFSFYHGSHQELGGGDINDIYFFHPDVDLSRWDGVSFSHGHRDQSEDDLNFNMWLQDLDPEYYVEVVDPNS